MKVGRFFVVSITVSLLVIIDITDIKLLVHRVSKLRAFRFVGLAAEGWKVYPESSSSR